jgi:hypothetical protein
MRQQQGDQNPIRLLERCRLATPLGNAGWTLDLPPPSNMVQIQAIQKAPRNTFFVSVLKDTAWFIELVVLMELALIA